MSWSKLVLNACPDGPVLQLDLVMKVRLNARGNVENGERKWQRRATGRKAVAKMERRW